MSNKNRNHLTLNFWMSLNASQILLMWGAVVVSVLRFSPDSTVCLPAANVHPLQGFVQCVITAVDEEDGRSAASTGPLDQSVAAG